MIDLDRLEELEKAATPGPWSWMIHDYSMASIEGIRGEEEHVLSVSPCRNCIQHIEDNMDGGWRWGRCRTPKERDAMAIVAIRNAAPALIAELREARGMVDNLTTKIAELMVETANQQTIIHALEKK